MPTIAYSKRKSKAGSTYELSVWQDGNYGEVDVSVHKIRPWFFANEKILSQTFKSGFKTEAQDYYKDLLNTFDTNPLFP